MTKTSDNRLPDGNPFTFVDTPTISNSNGNQITFADNIVPSNANTYDISGGWRLMAAAGGEFDSVSTDSISTRQAAQIQLTNDIYPNFDNQRSLGSTSLKFANIYGNDIRGVTLRADTLHTYLGSAIQTNSSIRPVSNNSADLGTSTTRFNSVNATTTNTNNISSVTGSALRLTTQDTNVIIPGKDIIPEVSGILQLGTASFPYSNVFGLHLYQDRQYTFSTFSWGSPGAGATVSSSSYTTVPIDLGGSVYAGTFNQIVFPTPGLYAITFDSNADVALGGAFNYIQYRLWETTTSAAYSPPVYHYVGGSSGVQSTQFTLYTYISNTGLRVRIEVAKQSGGANVTNVFFGQCVVYRISPTFN